jgi:hypothetical protein
MSFYTFNQQQLRANGAHSAGVLLNFCGKFDWRIITPLHHASKIYETKNNNFHFYISFDRN